MKKNKHCIRLKSGKEIYANGGIVGISKKLDIFYGHDGCIDVDESYKNPRYGDITKDEAKEIAEITIKRWVKFLKKVNKHIEETKLKQLS